MSAYRQGSGHMNAAVLYGAENLKIETVDIPKIGDDEVLVRVAVALTCGTDLKVWKRGYHARMIQPPSLFGHELAGVVEETGKNVNGGVQPGMRVLPANSAPCDTCFFCRKGQPNLCEDLLFNNGAYAEYIRIPGRIVRQNMIEIPDGISFKDAAMAEPLACVLRGIRETGVHPGDTVVVIGCGPIGLKFIRILSQRKVRVIAIGKRRSQMKAAERLGATATFDVDKIENPVELFSVTCGRRRFRTERAQSRDQRINYCTDCGRLLRTRGLDLRQPAVDFAETDNRSSEQAPDISGAR